MRLIRENSYIEKNELFSLCQKCEMLMNLDSGTESSIFDA